MAFPTAEAGTLSTQGAAPPRARPDGLAATDAMMARTEADLEAAIRAQVAQAPAVTRTPQRKTVTLNVITLSAGGQYGAFGAGFLRGWTGNGRPAQFDLVTGVSAGATLAPVAFAGPAFDPLLDYYDGLGADGIFVRRPTLAILGAPSIADPRPLRRFLRTALSPALLRAIANGHGQNRRLLIAATNIDNGAGQVFDLGQAADKARANTCLTEAILASAAIPALFPPRHINGALYADGGIRQHVFLQTLDEARQQIEATDNVDIKVNAYLIVNGALLPPLTQAEDSILGYAGRSVELLADEVLRDSIAEAVRFAEGRTDWTLRGVRAELPADTCAKELAETPNIGGFNACLTRALFAHGKAQATQSPIPWLSAADLRELAEAL